MKSIRFLLSLILLSSFIACNSDDDNNTDEIINEPTLIELRTQSTTILTSGTTKIWRIKQATLTNANGVIDISENFNVIDDEFIFGGTGENGTLEWRKGYEVNTNASNSSGTLLDNYVSSISTNFNYQDGSSTIVEADFGSCTFQINSDETINATITNENNSIFNFTLVEKTQNDYLTPPAVLNFNPAFTFESNGIDCCAPGMIGSYSANSFFLATREDGLGNGSARPERILKFDIATNTISENLFFQTDFVSKQMHIINNKLIVIGGQYVNKYNLDLSGDPTSANHGKRLSRFGISVLDNDVYIIGGDLNDVEGNKIFKWNISTQSLSEFATLPEPKSGARGTIVNDHLYVFGGSDAFFSETPTKTIYKVDINNPSQIETFQMNRPIDFTFVQKYQNLIYVAGRIEIRDGSGQTIGRESTIGVFNTLDNTYRELTTDLTNTSGFDTIHQMCLFNGKLYIIYGSQGRDNGGQFPEWDVLVSDIN